MRRREFLALLGGAAAFEPVATHAQTAGAAKRIGVLIGLSSAGQAEMTAFREGLAALGWTEGRNLRVEYRWPGSDPERIRAAAKELAELKLDLLVTRTTPGTLAMRSEARATPIVFVDRAATSPASPISRPASAASGWSS
jgi:putative ABC transport system substrate-binding protein